MARDLSLFLAQTVKRELPHLLALTEERACIARGPGKWSPKEELGHLIDSAVNNHIRFVREDDWVRLDGYESMQWDTIVNAWSQHNLLLAALVNRIPEEFMDALFHRCESRSGAGIREDYVLHMQHHIDQLLGREIVTQYGWRKPGVVA